MKAVVSIPEPLLHLLVPLPLPSSARTEVDRIADQIKQATRAKTIEKERPLWLVARVMHTDPCAGLAVWCRNCKLVDTSDSKKVGHWLNLAKSLIERHAKQTGRKQVHSPGWRANCLRGMFRNLQRRNTELGDCPVLFDKFLERLFELPKSKQNTNRLTQRFLEYRPADQKDFSALGKFLKDGGAHWTRSPEFLISLSRSFHRPTLRELFEKKAPKTKAVALHAIRSDLLAQQEELRAMFRQHIDPILRGRDFILELGDRRRAEDVDAKFAALGLFSPDLTNEIAEEQRRRNARRRRPTAKFRQK